MKIAFYVAAVPEWAPKLKSVGALSGSFSRYEEMPQVTVEDAVDMLNKRFAAFALNKQKPPRIDENLVRRVYRRSLDENEKVTWRTFIKSIVYDELQQKHFTILESPPLSISEEKSKAIREMLEFDPAVKGQFNSLLFGRIDNFENRVECLKRLMDVYLKEGIRESTLKGLSADERYYYERLASSKLIRKRVVGGEASYTISPELGAVDEQIAGQFGLTLPDYLLPIYGASQLRTAKGESVVVETTKLEQLAGRTGPGGLGSLLKQASASHSLILSRLNQINEPVDARLVELASQSIINVTRAWALVEHCPLPENLEETEDFWSENWVLPGAVSEFFKATGVELRSEKEIRYAIRMYEQAFAGIVDRLVKLYDASRLLFLPRKKLTRQELEVLDRARNHFLAHNYFPAMKECTEIVENRLRKFRFNIFSLLYGGPQRRANRLDTNSARYVQSNREKNQYADTNEFESLNRGQYKTFIVGPDPHGRSNWKEIFEPAFDPWGEEKVKEFLERFASINTKTSHGVTEAFPADNASEMHRYFLDCVTFLGCMNLTYQRLTTCHYFNPNGTQPQEAHYFSLYEFADKDGLTPIFISEEKLSQLVGEFESKVGVNPFVDLSDWQYIKTVFNCDYRQFMAFLSTVWNVSQTNKKDLPVKVAVTTWFGSEGRMELEFSRPSS
jgi:hypothetical protein